jgi:prepilin-type N-terminal cleavage/methylation domain-containing protein
MKCDLHKAGTRLRRPLSLRPNRGLTLVELVVVISVVSILAATAAARAFQATKQARFNGTMAEVRKYHQAAMIYLNRNGRYPNDGFPNGYPTDFSGYIPRYQFEQGPPLGGQWDWNGPGTTMPHFGLAVRVLPTDTAQIAEFQEFDTQYDDGNLATGYIQRVSFGSGVFLQFVLETR